MTTFAENEILLKAAMTLSENSVKHIAAESGIKANTLYKWKTTNVHLSPAKADALLLYFLENEPKAILKDKSLLLYQKRSEDNDSCLKL